MGELRVGVVAEEDRDPGVDEGEDAGIVDLRRRHQGAVGGEEGEPAGVVDSEAEAADRRRPGAATVPSLALAEEGAATRAALADDDRPIHILFAGKAHPADQPGKGLIQQVVAYGATSDANGRFSFIPDYDIAVARATPLSMNQYKVQMARTAVKRALLRAVETI